MKLAIALVPPTIILYAIQISIFYSLLFGHLWPWLAFFDTVVAKLLLIILFGLLLRGISLAITNFTPVLPLSDLLSETEQFKEFTIQTFHFYFATGMLILEILILLMLSVFQLTGWIGSTSFFTTVIGRWVLLFSCNAPFLTMVFGNSISWGDDKCARIVKTSRNIIESDDGKLNAILYFNLGYLFVLVALVSGVVVLIVRLAIN